MSEVNPYATEVRYMLDCMGYLLHQQQPRSVCIYSDSEEMVKATVRRIVHDGYWIAVGTDRMRDAVRAALGVEVAVRGTEPLDAALVPWSFETARMPREESVVGAVLNAVSYKSLLYPGSVRSTAAGTLARIRRRYHVDRVVGMYPPRFIALLGLAQLALRRSQAAYFRLSDLAMQHIYETGPMWRLSYVVIFAGRR